jgi:hypothetical protein
MVNSANPSFIPSNAHMHPKLLPITQINMLTIIKASPQALGQSYPPMPSSVPN